MSVETVRLLSHRVFASSWMWRILIATYIGITLIVLAPVLFASVGADDRFWILEVAPRAQGSYWEALWGPLSHAFQFNAQSRSTALASAERQVLALFTMDLATFFSIPPAAIWAAVKIVMLALGVFAVVAFLRQLRFRDGQGHIRGIAPASIAFITIALPLTIAVGSKSQNVASLNGWNFYPTLTYGPLVVYLLSAVFVLKCSTLLHRNYRLWVAPVVIVMAVAALMLNLSYELLALTIPLSALLLFIQPLQPPLSGNTLWRRWRGKLTVFLALAGTYSVIFMWIRWRVSQMACQRTDTCYSGTVVSLDRHTLWNNFVGAIPGNNGAFVGQQAKSTGQDFPNVSSLSVVVAVVGATALLGLWMCWKARQTARAIDDDSRDETTIGKPGDDIRGLLIVIATGLMIAVGSAMITGITARAVEMVQTPMLPYRNGVVTWSALALAGLAGVRLLLVVRWRIVGYGAVAALMILLIGSISLYLPRNVLSAQDNRTSAGGPFADTLHWEVASGDNSAAGDERRCEFIRTYQSHQKKPTANFIRAMNGAYASYDFYHHAPFCSIGLGLPK